VLPVYNLRKSSLVTEMASSAQVTRIYLHIYFMLQTMLACFSGGHILPVEQECTTLKLETYLISLQQHCTL